jgi:PIN domain nuclease of toxin-antitoxin system
LTHSHLLDASALLAAIFNEPGGDLVRELADDSEIHAVNLAEVMRKMVVVGMPADEVIAQVEALNLEVIEGLGVEQVREIARFAPEAKRLGLSIGDCVCLTTAECNHVVAVTAERRWPEIRGRKVKILLIR